MTKKTNLRPANILLEKHLKELRLDFLAEHQFDGVRKWRADYWLNGIRYDGRNVLIEIHGGIWTRGRHVRGKGFENDRIKMNTAQLEGFIVLEFSTGQVLRGEAKKFLAEWMGK